MDNLVIPELEAIIRSQNVKARVLLLDIETSPMEVYVWGLYKQRINPDNVIKNWALLTWAAKWLCADKVMSARVNTREAKARKDVRIVRKMWKLLEEADIVIAHNAYKFDIRRLNARFIINGLKPPMPYQVIDTLKVCRKVFDIPSNKLDYLNKLFGNRAKIHTEFSLWVRCISGDQSALEEMETYNRSDVLALEDLYFDIRPWMKSHPNMGIYANTEEPICPACGNNNLEYGGYYVTPAGKYRAFRCYCGAVGRKRHNAMSKDDRAALARSVAR